MFNLSPQCTGGNTLFRHPSYQTARPTRPTRPIELSHQTVLSNRALKCVKFLQYCDSLMPEMVHLQYCNTALIIVVRCLIYRLTVHRRLHPFPAPLQQPSLARGVNYGSRAPVGFPTGAPVGFRHLLHCSRLTPDRGGCKNVARIEFPSLQDVLRRPRHTSMPPLPDVELSKHRSQAAAHSRANPFSAARVSPRPPRLPLHNLIRDIPPSHTNTAFPFS